MSRENSQAVEGVVTSDAMRPNSMHGKRFLVIGIALVLVLGLGVGGWFVVKRMSPAKKSLISSADLSKLPPSEALSIAQTEVKNAQTPSEKQAAYTTLGDVYTSAGQESQSVVAYQQALTYSPDDLILLEELSTAYDDVGDTADAIKTLQKLINAINASNLDTTTKEWLLSRYQAQLKHDTGDY